MMKLLRRYEATQGFMSRKTSLDFLVDDDDKFIDDDGILKDTQTVS